MDGVGDFNLSGEILTLVLLSLVTGGEVEDDFPWDRELEVSNIV